jgi:hypothetical protein
MDGQENFFACELSLRVHCNKQTVQSEGVASQLFLLGERIRAGMGFIVGTFLSATLGRRNLPGSAVPFRGIHSFLIGLMATVRVLLALAAAFIGIFFALPVAVIWLFFWLVAYLTKLGSRLFEPCTIPSEQLVEFTSTIGWKPKANLDAHYLTTVKDGVFHTVTDSQGWPDRSTISESSVVVFGDSYAFGYGVNTRATFWRGKTGTSIKAIGAPGYNMVQEVLLMEQLSCHLKGKLVVWFIYFGNDLYDNLLPNNRHYRTPFVCKNNHSGNWEITTRHVSPMSWPNGADPRYYDKLAEMCCTTFLSERAYSACEFLVSKAKTICAEAEAKLVLMTIPDVIELTSTGRDKLAASAPDLQSFDGNRPDKEINKIASKFGVPVIALKNHLTAEDYKERDPHWNERGHQRVAQIIHQVWNDICCKETSHNKNDRVVEPFLNTNVSSPL